MRFTVEKDEFLDVLKVVSLALPKSSALPILNNIYIEVQGNKAELRATNLDFSILARIDVTGEEDGIVTLPGKTLNSIVNLLPPGPIVFYSEETKTVIQTSTGSYSINGLSPEDFPPIKEVSAEQVVDLPLPLLKKGIEKSVFCVAKDDPRPYLNGVLMELKDGEFRFVASDAHRLALFKVINEKFEGSFSAILPKEPLDFFKRIPDSESDVTMIYSEKMVQFEKGPYKLITRLIEGPYANYEDVIPAPDGNILRVSTDVFLEALKRVMNFTESPTYMVKLSVSQEKVILSASSSSVGEGIEEIPANYIGEDLEIGLNGSLLLDILRHIDDEEMLMRLYSATAAVRFDPANPMDDEGLLYLMMPLRLE